MLNTISTSKLYRECCEKSNIKILRIEDLVYNEIFIKSAEPLRDDKNILIGYNVVSLEGTIKYDRKVITEFYRIVDNSNFSRLNKLDLTSITEHFKNIGIHIIVEFKEGELLATYSIDKEVYSNAINSKGITNIDVDTWKKIKSAKVLNTYAHLEMYSHKSLATVDFIKQLEDFTGIKREKGNISKELATTIETFKKLGIEITINLNCGEKNPQKDRYKKATVDIEYKEVQAPKREEIKEPRKPREEKKQPKETDVTEINKDNEWAWEIYLDAMRFSKIGGQGLSRKDLDTLIDSIGWDNIKKGLTNAEENKRVTSPVTIKNFTDESKKWVLGAVSEKDKRTGVVGIWSIYSESRETWEEYKNMINKTEFTEEDEEEVY